MTMDAFLLDDAARLLGLTRDQLDAELAGLDGALGVLGRGSAARFSDEGAMLRFLEYRRSLAGLPSVEGPEAAALQEILRILAMVDEVKLQRDAALAEVRDLRRLLHKVVVDNVLLTERVNELSVVRMRDRAPSTGALRPWYQRVWARLLGRSARGGPGHRVRRVA